LKTDNMKNIETVNRLKYTEKNGLL